MARYFRITGTSDWVNDPQREHAARILAQMELGSVESRVAARAMLTHSGDEPLFLHIDGTLLLHEHLFQPKIARDVLAAVTRRLPNVNVTCCPAQGW
jgi:hypothetical protein